ncbi:MAG: efflux RND transporter periplasmic adaptor subunit, partial [Deltaproteobacteria bacterium]|nr:efflux RND transporter periplasmic adaptor subunit [Deltaproteobacteria bacterium]
MSHRHLILFASLSLTACGQAHGEAPEPSEPRGEGHAEPEAEAEPADDGKLHIDPDMLRDLRLTTTVVRARVQVETVQAIGEIRLNPDAASHVGSLVAARIVELRAKVGDTVTAGMVLAVLESPEVGRARSELIAARAQLGAAQRILGRKQRLAADQVVSASDSDRASAEVAQARGTVDSAQALLAALGASDDESGKAALSGGQFVVRARTAGTVLTRDAVLGAHTDAEDTIFTLGDLSRLIAVVHPFE